MLIKSFIIVAFIIILISLGSALYYLVNRKDEEDSYKIARALTIRIGLSLLLFTLIFLAFASGLIQPHGIGARMQQLQHQSLNKP